MPKSTFPRDRFDDLPADPGRVGAHRAQRPRSRSWLVFLWAAVATILLIVVGIGGVLLASGRVSPEARPTATPTVTATPTPAVLDTSYSVVVLNGTGEEGLAGNLRDRIVELGWPDAGVQTGNSDSTDFATTTVYYRATEDEAAARGLADAIGGAQVALSDFLQPTDDPDTDDDEGAEKRLVVVIGLDRVPVVPTP